MKYWSLLGAVALLSANVSANENRGDARERIEPRGFLYGFGLSANQEIYKGYDWAVENCTVKGKPIEHRNKLINGYDNAKRKTKSAVIIGKFEEGYYDD